MTMQIVFSNSVSLRLSLAAIAWCVPAFVAASEAIDFNRDIRPLLSDRCYLCHGPDEAARQADLRLDNFSDATASVIIPGDADGSELIARISSSDPTSTVQRSRSGNRGLPARTRRTAAAASADRCPDNVASVHRVGKKMSPVR